MLGRYFYPYTAQIIGYFYPSIGKIIQKGQKFLILHGPHIPLDDLPVDACSFHFFPSTLNKRITVHAHSKAETVSFPRRVTAIFKMFDILIALQGIGAAARLEMIRGIPGSVKIVF